MCEKSDEMNTNYDINVAYNCLVQRLSMLQYNQCFTRCLCHLIVIIVAHMSWIICFATSDRRKSPVAITKTLFIINHKGSSQHFSVPQVQSVLHDVVATNQPCAHSQ